MRETLRAAVIDAGELAAHDARGGAELGVGLRDAGGPSVRRPGVDDTTIRRSIAAVGAPFGVAGGCRFATELAHAARHRAARHARIHACIRCRAGSLFADPDLRRLRLAGIRIGVAVATAHRIEDPGTADRNGFALPRGSAACSGAPQHRRQHGCRALEVGGARPPTIGRRRCPRITSTTVRGGTCALRGHACSGLLGVARIQIRLAIATADEIDDIGADARPRRTRPGGTASVSCAVIRRGALRIVRAADLARIRTTGVRMPTTGVRFPGIDCTRILVAGVPMIATGIAAPGVGKTRIGQSHVSGICLEPGVGFNPGVPEAGVGFESRVSDR